MSTLPVKTVFVGVVGQILEFTIVDAAGNPIDISGATVQRFLILRPDGQLLTRTTSFTSDGTDGKIRYSTVAEDLTVKDTYYIQAYLELPTWQGHSEIKEFEVFAPLG